MEQHKKLITTLSDNETCEIEPIIERLNGLKELLIIVTDGRMRDKITDEISSLEAQRDVWWKKVLFQNCKEDYLSCDWEIDFVTNRIWALSSSWAGNHIL